METTPRVLRVDDPASLLAGVPYLLGFLPDDDIVVVVTTPSTRRVALTMRLDLPAAGEHRDRDIDGTVEALAAPLRRMPEARAYVVLYPAGAGGQPPPGRPTGQDDLVAALLVGLEAAGAQLGDVLIVAGGRWWSALCGEPGCCPPDGRPLDTEQAWRVRAELVAAGRAPAASRAQVQARVDALPADDTEALRELCARERDAVAGGERDLGERVEAMLELACRGPLAGQAPLDELAGFYGGMAHLAVRDVVVGELLRAEALLLAQGGADVDGRTLAREAFVALTRRAPAGFVAPVATCAAVLAYTSGEGALAWSAWDRAVADDPAYSLALLLESAMRGGLPPHELRSAFTAFLEVVPV